MNGLCLVDFDFTCVDPFLEDVEVVLKFCEATIGSAWTAISPVSSAKVAMVV